MSERILIIDDSQTAVAMMTHSLGQAGFKDIQTTNDSSKGLEIASVFNPELVVIDAALEDMTGFELCKKVRAVVDSSAKIVIITGSAEMVDISKVRSAGADEFVVKTADFELLVETAKRLFGGSEPSE